MSAAIALCPSPRLSTSARRNRDDVLQRPANLDADDIVGDIEPNGRTAELRLHELRGRTRRRDATDTAVGSAARELRARSVGPESTTIGHAGPGFVGDHLRHPQQRALLEPLHRADERRRGRRSGDGACAASRAGRATARRRRRATRPAARRPSTRWARRARRGSRPAGRSAFSRRGASRRRARRRGPTAARRDRVRARCTASAVPQLPAPRIGYRLHRTSQVTSASVSAEQGKPSEPADQWDGAASAADDVTAR